MFINSKKCFEIREGDKKMVVPRGFIGEIPDWAATHWMIQAAIQDGSIATPAGAADKSLEAADAEAAQKAEVSDLRPGQPGSKATGEPDKQPGGRAKEKA